MLVKNFLLVAWLSSLSFAPALAEEQGTRAILCPEPARIVRLDIPGSFHSVLTATNEEGLAFGYFGSVFADPKDLAFAAAEVYEFNGHWRFSCAYEKAGFGLPLETRDDLAYRDCHFKGGSQRCYGTIESCALICPAAAETLN